MFDKIWDFLIEIIDRLYIFNIIPYYDQGVRLRFGKPVKVLNPGFHWKWPIVDDILTHMVKTTTLNLPEQSLTTNDDKTVVIKVALKYSVEDVRVLLLEVSTPVDALSDMACGIVRDKVMVRNWTECNSDSLISDISRSVKIEAKKWGIAIDKVTITDFGIIKTIRLLNTTS